MAVKKSRTGKKKRPIYGPQGTGGQPTPEEQQKVQANYISYKRARYANYAAIILLLVAMVILFVAPNQQNVTNLLVAIAYAITIVSGLLILYTSNYVEEKRKRMTSITGWIMMGVGAFGLGINCYAMFVA